MEQSESEAELEGADDTDRKEMAELLSSREKTLNDFPRLKETAVRLLESGFKPVEFMGEFAMLDVELLAFRERCPENFWSRHEIAFSKWKGRRRARLETTKGSHDLSVLQATDPDYNPKQRVELNIPVVEGVRILLPEQKKPIDMVEGPKDTFNAETDGG